LVHFGTVSGAFHGSGKYLLPLEFAEYQMTPEDQARKTIDDLLESSGWLVQDRPRANLEAGRGVAIREFSLGHGYGEADYMLFVDGRAAGVIEAKKEGSTLTGVELQTKKYSEELPDGLPTPIRPLPFCYQSTGIETRFTNASEPDASSRAVFCFHTPETLSRWLSDEVESAGSTPKARLQSMPPLIVDGLRPAQITAIHSLEDSLRQGRGQTVGWSISNDDLSDDNGEKSISYSDHDARLRKSEWAGRHSQYRFAWYRSYAGCVSARLLYLRPRLRREWQRYSPASMS
jgi:hypothetical protein